MRITRFGDEAVRDSIPCTDVQHEETQVSASHTPKVTEHGTNVPMFYASVTQNQGTIDVSNHEEEMSDALNLAYAIAVQHADEISQNLKDAGVAAAI